MQFALCLNKDIYKSTSFCHFQDRSITHLRRRSHSAKAHLKNPRLMNCGTVKRRTGRVFFTKGRVGKKHFSFNSLARDITQSRFGAQRKTREMPGFLTPGLFGQVWWEESGGNATLWLREAPHPRSSSPLCPLGARFPASSTNIKLIKRQRLASEQTNMLISIDTGVWEQFMCINEVKNRAKQLYSASFGMRSQPHAGLPDDPRFWTWAEFNRPLWNGFVQWLCTVIMYSLWHFCKCCE